MPFRFCKLRRTTGILRPQKERAQNHKPDFFTRSDQQVAVRRLTDEDVADNSEAQFGPKLVQSLNKFPLVAVGVKDRGLPVGVGGQAVEVV